MSNADLTGAWEGEIHGTNQGRVYLKITTVAEGLHVDLRISDFDLGIYSLAGSGEVYGDVLKVRLLPRNAPSNIHLSAVNATATLDGSGQLTGEWESQEGTAGAFVAMRVPSATSGQSVSGQLQTAFVMMRVAQDDANAEDVLDAIKVTCSDHNIEALRSDDVEHSDKITDVILKSIRDKDLLICDLTSERPNVYYELGFAHGIGRKVILLAREGTVIHFDIKDYNVIFYRNMVALRGKLGTRIDAMMSDGSA